MRFTPETLGKLAAVAVTGFAAVYIARKGVVGAASAAAEGATRVVVDAATGAVIGIGKAAGVPETNVNECARAIQEGRMWDASFACPAGTFIKSVFTGKPPVDNTILDANDARARAGLNGLPECGCQRANMLSAEAWIGLAALSFALYSHVSNKGRHRE